MKSPLFLVLLLLTGLVLRIHGWQFVVSEHPGLGFLLVIGGTIVTLSIVLLA